MNLIYFLSIFILIAVVLTIKDVVLPPNNKKNATYWVTLLLTTLIIVCCIYLLQTFIIENFHFEVSPPRKLGMQEHVLPLIKPGDDPGYGTQSVDYPVQGSGITCSKAYIGHEGNLEMNIGEWKRGSGDGIPARPDIYLNGNATKIPFAANCQSCEVNRGTFEIENPDKPCPSPYFENDDKKMVKENYEEDALESLQIVMYSRDGCPFCVKAKEMFGDQISKITVKNNEGTPEGVNGVPHFESRTTGKTHTGCPSSTDELINKLEGVKENYQPKPYNSQYFDYNNYIAPYEKDVLSTLSCYSGDCPLKNKTGKVGVPFV